MAFPSFHKDAFATGCAALILTVVSRRSAFESATCCGAACVFSRDRTASGTAAAPRKSATINRLMSGKPRMVSFPALLQRRHNVGYVLAEGRFEFLHLPGSVSIRDQFRPFLGAGFAD